MVINNPEPNKQAKIKVVGVGGGGSNAVSRMYKERIPGIEYHVVNTDTQALITSDVQMRTSIGDILTEGKGVGGNPEIGMKAAEESKEQLAETFSECDMVFVAAGMGGGTGTGAAPVIAEVVKNTGALTVGVVTTPFSFEGTRRMKNAEEGIKKLAKNVDTLLIIPNDRLQVVCKEEMTTSNAFKMADDVLRLGVQSIAELITVPGEINLDFADVQAIMKDAGPAWMSIGYGVGENRSREAAHQAISNPLLEVSIDGATGVLFNITGGSDLKLSELHEAAEVLQEVVDPNCNIIFGMTTDERMENEIKLTVIATGFTAAGNPVSDDYDNDLQELLESSDEEIEQEKQMKLSDIDLPPFLRRISRYRNQTSTTK